MDNELNTYFRVDEELEERAQRAIDNYFSTHMVVPSPSPWNDNANKQPFQLPRTPQTPCKLY